ncbi:di-trans,poly-cis-decaprenylcistransferase [bacterium]|nr:di-trans,poly-cis-decaprenylcistransferase [bacterium]
MSPVLTAETLPSHQAQTLEQAAAAGVNLERLPRHIAIIMDGNGRWARSMRRPRIEGHRAGIKTVREIVRTCRRLEIPHLTLYAFSAENWKRPSAEVNALMFLLCNFLKREIREMKENGIQLRAIGRLNELPKPVQRALDYAINETSGGDKLRLTLALSYGGRLEIVDAVKATAQKVKNGELSLEDITPEQFSGELNTAGTPDKEIMVRKRGEMRV